MPELPEVETTVRGLQKKVVGKTIVDVWSSYPKKDYVRKDEIKNATFFAKFKKQTKGAKIVKVLRRGKNILIYLDNNLVILVHMKLTGHFLYGKYKKVKTEWKPIDPSSPLANPFSRHVRFIIEFTDGTHLALSDMRTFAKITLVQKSELESSRHLAGLGPEVLDKSFTREVFKEQLQKKPTLPVKTALMEQSLFVGVGNIYSDELLWLAGINPHRTVASLSTRETSDMFHHLKPLLEKGISFQGDSTSDYRTIDGVAGEFQLHKHAYQNTGKPCNKRGCKGVILRSVIRGRSAHYCDTHQI